MRHKALAVLAAVLLPVLALVIVVPANAAGATGEATVIPIQVTGDPANRFTMVIVGDGYTAAELPQFRQDVERHLNTLWSIEPYRTYRSYFDVYAVAVPSKDSGISCDPELSSPHKDTPLESALWSGCRADGIKRLLVVGKPDAARNYAAMATPDYDQLLVLANSDTYGGSGGKMATATGGNALSALITPHELGHSLGGLADEYDYYYRGKPGGDYTGPEPDVVHLTRYTTEQMRTKHLKWWRWLGEPSAAGGTIGRYQGGQYHTTGIWRPSRHSIMKSLGYQYDQVERERMTQRISQQAKLVTASTATGDPVPANGTVWVRTPYPVFHQLDVGWSVNGRPVPDTGNARDLELTAAGAHAGDTVSVTVTDPTTFVRDPAVRATMTTTRSWTVGRAASAASGTVGFTGSTPANRPINGNQVVYAYPTHPAGHPSRVAWQLDGTAVDDGDGNHHSVDLSELHLPGGTHTLTATVTDPAAASAGSQTLTWTVDNRAPRTSAALSDSLIRFSRDGEPDHYVFSGRFTMKLTRHDDQPGYLEGEFRLNHDGWYNYYGWPTDPDAPFRFTPTGTAINGLVYGNLGSGGMSLSPFVHRTPGYGGTHTVEYRGIDAAGNVGAGRRFDATVLPAAPACTRTVTGTHTGPLAVSEGVTCLHDARVSGPVRVTDGASLVASGGSITGPVTAHGAAVVRLVGTRVTGPVDVSATSDALGLFGTHVTGPMSLLDNATTYPPTVAGNTVTGPLRCAGNTPAPSDIDVPNRVAGPAGGQCTFR